MRIRGAFFSQPTGLGQVKDIDSKIAEAEKGRDEAKRKFNEAERQLKHWSELYGKEPRNDHYKAQFDLYIKLVDTWGAELGRLIKLVKDLKRLKYEAPRPVGYRPAQRVVTASTEVQRQATAYRPSRIPNLPFGGSFWGGGLT